jgi:lipopolysaccharide export system protein LptA
VQDTTHYTGLKKMVIYFIRLALLISIIVYSLPVDAQVEGTQPVDANAEAIEAEKRNDSLKKAGLQASPFNSKVTFKAKDSIFIDLKQRKVYLYGDAEVYYEKTELKGAVITLDFKTSEIYAEHITDSTGKKVGLPNFKQDGQNIDADKIGYNFKTKRAKISNLVMKEGEGRIYGDRVVKDQDNNIYVGDAKYTTCDAEHPHFYIHAPRLKIVPGKQIVSGPANLVIADIPTPAWIPFGFFPVRQGRKSGILMPGYGFSPGQGYFLRNGGYYFGISDYFDLALTGDAYTQGTWALRTSSTYAKRYKYSGNIQIAYANNQRGSPEDISGFSRQRNYNIIWNHRLDPKARPNTTFNANVNYQSPSYQQFNSYNPATIIQSQVNSSVSYSKVLGGGKYNMGISTSASQNNNTKDVNLTLPSFNFDVLRFFPFKRKQQIGEKRWYEDIGVNYAFNLQNNISTKDSLLLKEETLKNMRNGSIHRASVSTQFKVLKWFSLNPSLSVNEYWYLQSIEKTWNKDSLRLETDTIRGFTRASDFNFNTNLTTMLYGTFPIKAGPVQAIRHVMTLNASLNFRPDFSDAGFGIYKKVQADSANTKQELYSRLGNGIFGGPGQGRVGQLGLNLNNNLEMKLRRKTDTGFREEKVKIFESFSIAGAYNFFAEQKKLSPITLNARTVLFKQLSILLNGFTFSPYAIDSTGEREGNDYLVNTNGKLARFTNGSVALSTTLNSSMFDGKKDGNDDGPVQPGVNSLQKAALLSNPNLTAYDLALLSSMGDFVNFNVPWSLTLNYNYNYAKPATKKIITQTVTFSGDMNLTENWKVAFSSGYDFTQKQVNLTSVDLYRQLHCWEFKFSWIPIGPRQYFLFTLNVKSSVLQDLKINRRRDWFDNN